MPIHFGEAKTKCIHFSRETCWLELKSKQKAFDDFKNKQKKKWSNVFWFAAVCIFSVQYTRSVFNTLYIEIKHKCYKFPSVQKMHSFFFRKLQLITVLLLTCDSYMSWNTRFLCQKLGVGFSIFSSVLFLLKFIFLFNKIHELLDFETC